MTTELEAKETLPHRSRTSYPSLHAPRSETMISDKSSALSESAAAQRTSLTCSFCRRLTTLGPFGSRPLRSSIEVAFYVRKKAVLQSDGSGMMLLRACRRVT